ncbi:MAG: hypothetical protein FJX80_12745 [Bacteroidetes bacterium]|nr:hypothetical protein [Bacteroidota bacterium]
MGLFEKFKYQFDNQESKAKKSHLRNLFIVALADGKLENIEFEFILHIADNMYIDRSIVREIHSNLNDIPFIVPTHEKQRIDQIYDLIHLTIIDGGIDDREVLACKNIFIKFGYRPVIFEIILNQIMESLSKKMIKEVAVQSIINRSILYN